MNMESMPVILLNCKSRENRLFFINNFFLILKNGTMGGHMYREELDLCQLQILKTMRKKIS